MSLLPLITTALHLAAQPGSLDASFNAEATLGHWAYSVTVQPDNKVVAAGTFGVMRFLEDGSADPSFQALRPGPLPFPGAGSRFGAVKLQPDGRIVATAPHLIDAAGEALPRMMRLHPDGSVDSSFTLDARAHPAGRVLGLQPDGKVVTSGFVAGDGDLEYAGLLRLNSDGSLDDGFDARSFNNSADFYSLTLAPEGAIYFGTLTEVLRANLDGSRDVSFGPEISYGPFGAIAEQWDGRVLIGHGGDGPTFRSLERFMPNSTDDPTWMVPSIDGGDHTIFSILLQPDNKVIFGGNTIYGVQSAPVSGLARLHPDGSLDATFQTYSDLRYYSVEDMALAPDGKLVVAGLFQDLQGEGSLRGVWRLNNDAGPDGIEFASSSYLAREGDGRIQIAVRRTTDIDRLAVVYYAVYPGTATRWSDYFGGSGLLVFRPGDTLKQIRLYIRRDRQSEDFETVRLKLVRARGGALGPQRRAILTIL